MAQRTCSIDGCERSHLARGWCSRHYKRWKKYGDPTHLARNVQPDTCSVDGCDNQPNARSLCPVHYYRAARYGDPTDAGDAARLRQAREADGPARLVDANGYARLYVAGTWVYEHRYVWEQVNGPIPDGGHIHHVNHGRSDNRIENLQLLPGRDHNRAHTTFRHASGQLVNRGAHSPRYLADVDDAEIVRLRRLGLSFREIGRRFGIAHETAANHYRRALAGDGNDGL